MDFYYVSTMPAKPKVNSVYLVHDNWNDWYYWVTQFNAIYVESLAKEYVSLGGVKIARQRMKSEKSKTGNEGFSTNSPALKPHFTELKPAFFSLGQTENYYETLCTLRASVREEILAGLRDCAYQLDIFEKFQNHPAMTESVMRDISVRHLRERLHKLARGLKILTGFHFSYLFPHKSAAEKEVRLEFKVDPDSLPPTNVHAIIGRNGVGKTTLFAGFISGVLGIAPEDVRGVGSLQTPDDFEDWGSNPSYFQSLNLLSYSPFDKFGPIAPNKIPAGVSYSYIGLMKRPKAEELGDEDKEKSGKDDKTPSLLPKSFDELYREFCSSMAECLKGVRRKRWHECLEILENDPLFKEADVTSLAERENISAKTDTKWRDEVHRLLRNLSSGHLVILLSITRLIEVVEERSITLIDEPEAHLHPPLISAFIRAVSHLMRDRNGVAVVATHSPVVLQEVPAECVWIINRTGPYVDADRPESETFGENVGALTREVFRHEVVNTGFYRMILEATEELNTYDEISRRFNSKLGSEARALARSLNNINKNQI